MQATYGHSMSVEYWEDHSNMSARLSLTPKPKPVKYKKHRQRIDSRTLQLHRPVGGNETGWEKMSLEQEFATVSYDEMCRTIDKRLQKHEETAKQQLRVRAAAAKLKLENPLKKSAEEYSAVAHDRLKSNKTGSPGLCSMGGVGVHKEVTERETLTSATAVISSSITKRT